MVDEVDNHLHHDIFFFGFTLGDHESESNERVVRQTFTSIFTIKDTIVVEER